ncbi:phage tail protein [Paenibacillus phocaensis]|uniref:phage tail protein n=1 Tax=Paenibacillus phocaensis TaxID=1776378 RepID=UPI00039B48A8|nr:phage tail protein [Paenibacillus phocaensis]
MAKSDWTLSDTVKPEDLNAIGEEINELRTEVDNIEVPPASLSEPGIVRLSNATDSTAEDTAATPRAVKDVALQAKAYTDQQINLVTETGIPKLVSYPLKVTATVDNQTEFEIPLDLFDADTDTLMVAINRAVLDPTQYTVTNTIRDGAGQVTQRAKITLLSGITATSEMTMVVLKNVPLGEDGAINGAVLAVDSVPINRVNGLQTQLDEVFQAGNERKQEVVDALVALGISASTGESWDVLISKLNGIINRGAGGTVIPGTANQTKAEGYYSSPITILGDANLVASNIKKDVNLFNVIGNLEYKQVYSVVLPNTKMGTRATVNIPFMPKLLYVTSNIYNTTTSKYDHFIFRSGFLMSEVAPTAETPTYELGLSYYNWNLATSLGLRLKFYKVGTSTEIGNVSSEAIPSSFDVYFASDDLSWADYYLLRNFRVQAYV